MINNQSVTDRIWLALLIKSRYMPPNPLAEFDKIWTVLKRYIVCVILTVLSCLASLKWDGNGWIKGNVGQTGFYRVNYEEKNWDALAEQLLYYHKVKKLWH